ncbi:MAG: ribonuclease P protein component [Candidatus Gottesmanbacteria bacterium]|nr:ribonuclease P protein component [Candidatus Gottesmanbacteria bacterium]
MLSSDHRLPKEEISPLLRTGTHVRSDIIELVYKKTDSVPRFAFIVSTKVDKRATARNRMRRTMSESVRHLLTKAGPLDGIFIARRNMSDLKQTDVQVLIEGLLRHAGVLNTEL